MDSGLSSEDTDGSASHLSWEAPPAEEEEDVDPPLVPEPLAEGDGMAAPDYRLMPDKPVVWLQQCPFSRKWWLAHAVTGEFHHIDCSGCACDPELHDDAADFMFVQEPLPGPAEDALDWWCSDKFDMNLYSHPGGQHFVGFECGDDTPARLGASGSYFLPLRDVQTRTDPCEVVWPVGPLGQEVRYGGCRLQCPHNGYSFLWKLQHIHQVCNLSVGKNHQASTWLHKRLAKLRLALEAVGLPAIVDAVPYSNSDREAAEVVVSSPSVSTSALRA